MRLVSMPKVRPAHNLHTRWKVAIVCGSGCKRAVTRCHDEVESDAREREVKVPQADQAAGWLKLVCHQPGAEPKRTDKRLAPQLPLFGGGG